jgi:hypothetical protein
VIEGLKRHVLHLTFTRSRGRTSFPSRDAGSAIAGGQRREGQELAQVGLVGRQVRGERGNDERNAGCMDVHPLLAERPSPVAHSWAGELLFAVASCCSKSVGDNMGIGL